MGRRWQGAVVGVEITVHAHATEDVGRVKAALEALLPEELRGKVEYEEQLLEGHHGNPITRIRVRVRGDDAVRVLEHIASRLSDAEKKALSSLLELRYDERAGRLYLRFSKQDAYLGEVRLYDGDDVIHVVVVFRGSPKLRDVEARLRELGLLA